MSQREALKTVVKFGKREYSEKKPLSLKVFRVKSRSILTRGMLPSLNIKQIQGTFYIIIADYGELLRIYSFGKEGQLFGGENIEKNLKFMKELTKFTTLAYHLPKEKPKLTIDDITKHYNEEYDKALQRTNQLFGFNLKRPYTIIAHDNLDLRMGRMIGCAKTRDEDKLVISPKAYKKDFFEAIITREIMYLYLREFIVLFQDIKSEVVYWYDLAILFTNFYLRNEKNEYLRHVMERATSSFLSFKDNSSYFLSERIIEVLKKNTKIYRTKESNLLLSNIFSCLRILKEYQIKLRYKEFANLFFGLCNLFLDTDSNKFFKQTTKLDYYVFHLDHLEKTSETDTESKKTLFLCKMFSILSGKVSEKVDLNKLIQDINQLTEDQIIQKEIINYPKVVDDAVIEYSLKNVISVDLKYKIDNKSLELVLEVKNDSNYIFEDFKYDLKWKPKNRIIIESKEVIQKSRDLHHSLSLNYSLSILTNGMLTLFCTISFKNPMNSKKRLQKDLKLKKIDL